VTEVAELGLLGPVRLRVAGETVDLGPPKQRAVLAALAVDAGQPVPVPVIVERVWDQAAPPHARDVLYGHLSAIRRTVRRACADDEPAVELLRRGGGYQLEIDSDQVDALRFRRLVKQARGPGTAPDTQAALLRQALDLWRGPALADLPCAWATRVRDAWQQQRLAAAMQWAEAELQLGRPAAVVEELLALTAEHPLAEPLLALLMRALHADGRDAEALQQYAAARHRLAEELGVDPGSELRAVHGGILCGTLPAPRGRPAMQRRARWDARPLPVPAQLPADVPAFTGRTGELAELDHLLGAGTADASAGAATAVVISAVSGTAGVGKTALAVHWAHRVLDVFPDGQLYVNLHGYDPGQPRPATEALAGFLSALGVPGQDIPLDVEDQAARYRTEISGRRMLVVLDNAGTVEQVRPLLPGTPSCSVVVTSRDSLAGLVALNGARRMDLDLLPTDEAVTLLRALIGDRVRAEPDAAAELAVQCARLPLALRVAGELARTRPATSLAELVGELADQQRRLDLLDAGRDARAAVRAVFSWSYRQLPAAAARAFRLLGLHPGPDWDPYAAAALLGCSLEQARQLLDLLTRAHLIHSIQPARYGMHDLMRAYAVQLARAQDGEPGRQAVLTRLFDLYRAGAAAAMDTLYSAEAHRRPHPPPAASPAPPLHDPAAALAWLDAERPNLVAACAHAAVHGWPQHSIQLATTLFRYLDTGGHCPDALTIHTHARDAARHARDKAAEAHALTSVAGVHFQQGRYAMAADHVRQALTLFAEVGDRRGEARALGNLGIVLWRHSRYDEAAAALLQARAMHRENGDRAGEAETLDHLGLVDERRGRYELAAEHHRQALDLSRALGHRVGEAAALNNLGHAYVQQDRYELAAEHHRQALDLSRATGHHDVEADALTSLGLVYRRQGRYELAAEHHRQALARYREIGDRGRETVALNNLGDVLQATGQLRRARIQHATALDLAVDTGDRHEQARAHTGLAQAHHAAGDDEQARHHWRQALALYTDLGVPAPTTPGTSSTHSTRRRPRRTAAPPPAAGGTGRSALHRADGEAGDEALQEQVEHERDRGRHEDRRRLQ
jgi:DNA-binding SARP family transcriptional activator/tetratricopeptide (TPR) repeat protein